jgi:hypothetical protein
LKSNGGSDLEKVNSIAAKAASNSVLVSALITSAATAKRIQSTMKMGKAYLDVDFAIPPRVNMKFLSLKANERDPDDGAGAAEKWAWCRKHLNKGEVAHVAAG